MNKVKYIHVIIIQSTFVYQYYDEKIVFNVRAMFAQYYSAIPLLHKILNNVLYKTDNKV